MWIAKYREWNKRGRFASSSAAPEARLKYEVHVHTAHQRPSRPAQSTLHLGWRPLNPFQDLTAFLFVG